MSGKKVCLLILLALLLCGCTGIGSPKGGPEDEGGSGRPPDVAKLGTAAVGDVAKASNQFAFEMYRKFAARGGNMLFSPYSISSALSMTYEGARGETATEMQAVLHVPEDAAVRQAAFKTLNEELNRENPQFTLNVANAIWTQSSFPIEPAFVSTLSQFYGSEAANLNFSATDSARQTINTWVSDHTSDRIPEIFAPSTPTPDTVFVLANAVYFKGRWLEEFEAEDTQDKTFHSPSGAISVPMMNKSSDEIAFYYAENEELQILELPYKGEIVSMIVLLPKDDNLAALEESLTGDGLSDLRASMTKQLLDITLPKFKLETDYDLIPVLTDMGMPLAFDPNAADFTGISAVGGIFLNAALHKAFIEVNEEGTEAAAATVVGGGATSGPPPRPYFNADHPFIYMIVERTSGLILFLGRVENPAGS